MIDFREDRTAKRTVSWVMLQVLIALLPGIALLTWFFGVGVLINCVIAIIAAELTEVLILIQRHKPLKPCITDLSAVVTAVLLALCLPSMAPWWITVVGTIFAIGIAKHLYGGLGYNPFNPAMVGYVVLLISFPKQMVVWLPPENIAAVSLSFWETMEVIIFEAVPKKIGFDTLTMATPLDAVKTGLTLSRPVSEIVQGRQFGALAGAGWDWVAAGYLLGGLWLVQRRVIDWRIPLSLLLGLFLVSTPFYIIDSRAFSTPVFHLFAGATMLGAFFIATDPVTAPATAKGRFVFGASIGLLIFVIRRWGGYPDGVAFAVLLMNLAVPTIDNYTRPRRLSENREPSRMKEE